MPIKAFNPSLFTLFFSQIFKKHQNKSAKYNTTVFLFCKYAAITRHTKYTCFFWFFLQFYNKIINFPPLASWLPPAHQP